MTIKKSARTTVIPVSLKTKNTSSALSASQQLAEAQLSSEALAVLVMQSRQKNVYGESFELGEAIQALERANERISAGHLELIQEALYSQAKALETLFTASIRTAAMQANLVQYQAHMNFALKAQAQSRATLQALIQLKQPHKSVFVSQANIASGHQQINNLLNPPLEENSLNFTNELIEVNHGSTQLDARAEAQTESNDSNLEALGAVNRA